MESGESLQGDMSLLPMDLECWAEHDQLKAKHGRMCDRVVAMGTDIENFQSAFAAVLDKLQALKDDVVPVDCEPKAAPSNHVVRTVVPQSEEFHAVGSTPLFVKRPAASAARTSVTGESNTSASSQFHGIVHSDTYNDIGTSSTESAVVFSANSLHAPEDQVEDMSRYTSDSGWDEQRSAVDLPKLDLLGSPCPVFLKQRWDKTCIERNVVAGSASAASTGSTTSRGAVRKGVVKSGDRSKHEKLYKLEGLWVGLEILSNSTEDKDEEEQDVRMARRYSNWSSTVEHLLGNPNDAVGYLTNKMDRYVIQPHSKGCILWNFAGMCLLFYDIIAIPLSVAWDLEMTDGTFAMFILAIVYWSLDILRTFFTSVYLQGELCQSKLQIATQYIRTWLIIDVCIVCIDYTILIAPSNEDLQIIRSARVLRMLRLMRLVRLLKMGEHSNKIEEALGMAGISGMIIVVALIKTFMGIFIAAHVISCFWYFLGRYNLDQGNGSWLLDTKVARGGAVGEQYLHALHWVLGQFTPAPSKIDAGCATERAFNILVIIFSLLVMGSSVSKVTSTIQQLNAMNSEKHRKRQHLQQYLTSNSVSVELSSRIMCFASHSLQNQGKVALDKTLISEALQKELTQFERGSGLCVHPMLKELSEIFEHVFCDICAVTTNCVYGKSEVVFAVGDWAEGLVVTVSGEYRLKNEQSTTVEGSLFVDPVWFAEISMFCKMIHSATLTAQAFGAIFKLAGGDLAQCAKKSPRCCLMICEYARALLGFHCDSIDKAYGTEEVDPKKFKETQETMCLTACQATSHRKTNHVKKIEHIRVRQSMLGFKYTSKDCVRHFLTQVLEGQLADSEVAAELQEVFSELHEEFGVYEQLDQSQERKSCLTSLMSVIWLLTDRYDLFTAGQAPKSRLTTEQWADMQLFVKWANMSMDTIQAVFAFLAIRGLGKAKMLSSQLPTIHQGPELTVLHLMRAAPNVVPSAERMGEDMCRLVETNLMIHTQFNLGQMMQGENLPFNVKKLQDYISETGEDSLKFYLVSLVGILCGIAGDGGQVVLGSRFMNENNGRTTLLCMSALQHLFGQPAQEVYWGYILARSQTFGLQISTPQEIALVRLACLNRAHDASDVEVVSDAWESLAVSDKNVLIDFFLRDGIVETTYLFSFLPLCFANARDNVAVGLASAFTVLAEIVDMMNANVNSESTLVTVDLSDLAVFFGTVKSQGVLLTCIMQSELVGDGSSLCLKMDWNQVNAGDGGDFDIGNGLIRVMRNQRAHADELANIKMQIALSLGTGTRIHSRQLEHCATWT